jgi:hypothetical protein
MLQNVIVERQSCWTNKLVNDSFATLGLGFRPKRQNLYGRNFLDEQIYMDENWMNNQPTCFSPKPIRV